MAEIRTYPDTDRLARAAAQHFVALAAQSIEGHGRFVVALSGGSTPRDAYALLAGDELASRVDWTGVHLFWGDERCVPPEHADSNYRMVREILLDHVPLPEDNVHRMRGELDPERAAIDYEQTLRHFFAGKSRGKEACSKVLIPDFDLVMLGLGVDGHTASLFPGTKGLDERTRWVVAHHVEALKAWRVTLTPVVINAAAQVTFVVSGAGKAQILSRVLTGRRRPNILPAQLIEPRDGQLLWLVDKEAGVSLERRSRSMFSSQHAPCPKPNDKNLREVKRWLR